MVHDKVRLPFVPAAGILKILSNCQLTSSLGPLARAPPARGESVLPTYSAPFSSPGLPISGPTLVFAYEAMSALWNKYSFTRCPSVISRKLPLNMPSMSEIRAKQMPSIYSMVLRFLKPSSLKVSEFKLIIRKYLLFFKLYLHSSRLFSPTNAPFY